MDYLDKLRKEIDDIDSEILNLLAKRTDTVRKIGRLKREHHLEPLDEKRWKEVLESRLSLAYSLNLSSDFIKKIYDLIHENSLAVENESK